MKSQISYAKSSTEALSRRTVIKVMGGVGASFTLGGLLNLGCLRANASDSDSGAAAFVPNVFLKINPDSTVEVTIVKSDMGQGVRTSLAMLVAEELDADWRNVRVVQAPGNAAVYGGQGTGGSSSVRSLHGPLRLIGATARAMLIAAAAKQWNVDPAACSTQAGMVVRTGTTRKIPYGSLTRFAATVPPPEPGVVKLKKSADFNILGQKTARIDNHDVVMGKAIYAGDVRLDGMKCAVVARAPVLGATVKSVDASGAKSIRGFIAIFPYQDRVAVVADNTWAAIQARNALKIAWNPNDNGKMSTATIRKSLTDAVLPHPAMPSGAKVVEAAYDLPYLAHAPMETLNAVADVRKGSCTVWAGTQAPDSAQSMVCGLLSLPASSVTINTTLLGGGFGRKANSDFIREAVMIARDAKCPIKLLWTREDDMKHDNYRPASHHAMCAALDGSGKPIAYAHQFIQASGKEGSKDFGKADLYYDIAGAVMRRAGVPTPLAPGAWRSVEHSQIIFANECFMDELAHAAGKDPLQFRLANTNDPRYQAVLKEAASTAGWGTQLSPGSGLGIAGFCGYGSYIAHVAQVSINGDTIKVDHIAAAVDVGQPVNPLGIEAQVQGGCSDGVALALTAAIDVQDGAVVQNSWDDYNWTSITTMPKIVTHIIQGADDFGGMGEVGVPSVAPAIANAVFAVTGKRVRKLPIKISELV